MKIFVISSVAANLTQRDIRNAFQKTKDGITSFLHNIPFDQLTSEFDDYTNFGSKLESVNGNVSKIKEKSFPEVISLFKKLNIRGVIDALNNKNTEFDEGEYGLFAEAIKGYGCWCLPNQGQPGIGEPVDELDRICHQFQTCKTCLGYDKCRISQMVYGWQTVTDKKGKKNVLCTDQFESCERNLCHCEVSMAEQLVALAKNFNPLFSHENGFNRNIHCGKHAIPITSETSTSTPITSTTTTSSTTEMSTLGNKITTEGFGIARTKQYFEIQDEYEAEDDEVQSLNIHAWKRLLASDYPEDPLVTTSLPLYDVQEDSPESRDVQELRYPSVYRSSAEEIVPKLVKTVDSPVSSRFSRPAVPVKMEFPVNLKSSFAKPKYEEIFQKAPSQPKCCGSYPYVQIYNPDRRKCCDGMIRSLGSC